MFPIARATHIDPGFYGGLRLFQQCFSFIEPKYLFMTISLAEMSQSEQSQAELSYVEISMAETPFESY